MSQGGAERALRRLGSGGGAGLLEKAVAFADLCVSPGHSEMVLERMKGVLTWAIDRYLGSIVTNVDSDALKTDLWRGNVELHGLQLRDDVLQSAGIPCVVSGTIRMAGVNASRDGSVKLTIAGVHAVVTPLVGDAARDVRLRELKEEDIRRCIAAALEGEGGGGGGGAEGGAEGAAGEGGAPAQGYLAQRISDTLMENIQLTVTDVQISYDHGPPLACPLPARCPPSSFLNPWVGAAQGRRARRRSRCSSISRGSA